MKIRLLFILSFATLPLAVPSAFAYDYQVGNFSGESAGYVHLETVSALCHDRTPVDMNAGDPRLETAQTRTGTTAPGCLISKVEFYTTAGVWSWDGVGQTGGTWTMTDYRYVCKNEGILGGYFDAAGVNSYGSLCQGN